MYDWNEEDHEDGRVLGMPHRFADKALGASSEWSFLHHDEIVVTEPGAAQGSETCQAYYAWGFAAYTDEPGTNTLFRDEWESTLEPTVDYWNTGVGAHSVGSVCFRVETYMEYCDDGPIMINGVVVDPDSRPRENPDRWSDWVGGMFWDMSAGHPPTTDECRGT